MRDKYQTTFTKEHPFFQKMFFIIAKIFPVRFSESCENPVIGPDHVLKDFHFSGFGNSCFYKSDRGTFMHFQKRQCNTQLRVETFRASYYFELIRNTMENPFFEGCLSYTSGYCNNRITELSSVVFCQLLKCSQNIRDFKINSISMKFYGSIFRNNKKTDSLFVSCFNKLISRSGMTRKREKKCSFCLLNFAGIEVNMCDSVQAGTYDLCFKNFRT